jgi:hypothetical protein
LSYILSVGYVKDGVEHIVTSVVQEGEPRKGPYDRVTAIEETNDEREYRALGISHLVERLLIGAVA